MIAATAFVVLFGFCSLTDSHCGIIRVLPDKEQSFKTQMECRKAAADLTADIKRQSAVLEHHPLKGPFTTKALCGTESQFEEAARIFGTWDEILDMPPPPAHVERPGDRDPYPNGG